MFGKSSKKSSEELHLLNAIYDFILDTTISEKERKIGTLAKIDLENGAYLPAVLNKLSVSFQKEAIQSKLSPSASNLYKEIQQLQDKVTPLGTNRGTILFTQGYLDK